VPGQADAGGGAPEPEEMPPMDEIAAARPDEVGFCARRIERVAAWMRAQVADGRLAGVVTAEQVGRALRDAS